jgi:formamidopyrimidine-DNA glycosylase
VFIDVRPGDVFVVSEMAGRILFHAAGAPMPAKYQLRIAFRDGTALTATVGLWGFFGLRKRKALTGPPFVADGIAPLGKEFTLARLNHLFAEYPRPAAPIKAFLVNHPSINGFGNGYMQEILLRAGIRPTRKVVDVTPAERRRLHAAVRQVLREAAAKGGSQDECDIYGKPGGYVKMLGAKVKSCRTCGSRIQKISFLGGATYFCPKCQSQACPADRGCPRGAPDVSSM